VLFEEVNDEVTTDENHEVIDKFHQLKRRMEKKLKAKGKIKKKLK
jgi:CRISPR/Cas system type I-B associated protein Csh2 (Cas7 group RAMP superfamily)